MVGSVFGAAMWAVSAFASNTYFLMVFFGLFGGIQILSRVHEFLNI